MLIVVLTCCTLHNLYGIQSMLKLMIYNNQIQWNFMIGFVDLHINFIKKWKCCNINLNIENVLFISWVIS
jgi:hypothetical protein